MKNTIKLIKIIGVIIITLLIIALFRPTWTPHIKGDNSISELEQIEINGSSHEIMIRGNDKNNPVIIVVHGGPGASEIPYVDKYQDLLEKDFTIVHYDQRASGKSYHFFEDYSNLSSDLLVEDLLVMTDYVSERLGKEKVILMSHSFGTYIAIQAAYQAPEKYEAYIGIGQMGDTVVSEIDILHYTIGQAQKVGNTEDISYLQGLTEKIKKGETVVPRNYVIKYDGDLRTIDHLGDDIISVLFSSEYNLLDILRHNYGMGYSQKMLLSDVLKNPLPDKVTKLEVPTYFLMGKYDYMTSSNAAKKYFDRIEADKKEFIAFEQSAHYPQFEEKENFYKWMKDTFIN